MKFQQELPATIPPATLQALLLAVYPIGHVYISALDNDPNVMFGGTWVAFGAGRVLVGLDASQQEFDALLEVGGAKSVVLDVSMMPAHTHVQNPHNHVQRQFPTATGALAGQTVDASMSGTQANSGVTTADTTAVNQNTGGGLPHPNLPPYIVVRMWRRTA